MSLSTCLISLLCFPLPDFLPGKRALAMGLCVYHSVASTVLFQAPRFIPHSFGPLAEQLSVIWRSIIVVSSVFMVYFRYKITPEILWGTLHGFAGLGMVVWWQATVHLVAMARSTPRASWTWTLPLVLSSTCCAFLMKCQLWLGDLAASGTVNGYDDLISPETLVEHVHVHLRHGMEVLHCIECYSERQIMNDIHNPLSLLLILLVMRSAMNTITECWSFRFNKHLLS